jgi:hypothetical protein
MTAFTHFPLSAALAWHGLRPGNARRLAASAIASAALVLAAVRVRGHYYLSNLWRHLRHTAEVKHRLEYQIAAWVDVNRPNTRSQDTGTVRFWWNVWTDIRWVKAIGVDNMVVNRRTSALPLGAFEDPHEYIGVLPVLWEDGKGSRIYGVPLKNAGRARENLQRHKVSEDPCGQVGVDLPPGTHTVQLHFDTPREKQAGRAVTVLTRLLLGFAFARKAR